MNFVHYHFQRVRRARAAVTLVEMMVSLGASTVILAALLTALITLQRNYAAVQAYASAEGNQGRISDYLSADLRRALGASAASNVLTIKIPDYYNTAGAAPSPGATPLNPSVVNNAVVYGTGAPVTVTYYQSGNAFYRSVNGTPTAIAVDVADFIVSVQDLVSTVTCTTTFSPRFTLAPSASAIAATSTFTKVYLRNASARN